MRTILLEPLLRVSHPSNKDDSYVCLCFLKGDTTEPAILHEYKLQVV